MRWCAIWGADHGSCPSVNFPGEFFAFRAPTFEGALVSDVRAGRGGFEQDRLNRIRLPRVCLNGLQLNRPEASWPQPYACSAAIRLPLFQVQASRRCDGQSDARVAAGWQMYD